MLNMIGRAVATLSCSADLPTIAVLLPVRREEQYIVGCIESLLAQDYPQERYEIHCSGRGVY